jgi:hypothetical protein
LGTDGDPRRTPPFLAQNHCVAWLDLGVETNHGSELSSSVSQGLFIHRPCPTSCSPQRSESTVPKTHGARPCRACTAATRWRLPRGAFLHQRELPEAVPSLEIGDIRSLRVARKIVASGVPAAICISSASPRGDRHGGRRRSPRPLISALRSRAFS